MFKALLLQSWYGLSDPALDKANVTQALLKEVNGKKTSTYGFKIHINVDEDGFTAGNVHDSQVLTQLLDPKDRAVYADSAYPSKKHSEWLAQRGIEDRMIARATTHRCAKIAKPLVGWHTLHG